MQATIKAGTTLNYIATGDEYPASAGWVVTLYLNPRDGSGTPASVASTPSGDDHLLQVAPDITAEWAPGWWAWELMVERGGERYPCGEGQLLVLASLRGAAAGVDTRSQAQRALDDARAALAAWTPTTKRYRINGREMEFNSPADIIAIVTHWQNEVRRENDAAAMAAGRPNPRKLQVRMGRA